MLPRAGARGSPNSAGNRADSGIGSRRGALHRGNLAVLSRSHLETRLERPVEGADGAVTAVERDGEDGKARLGGIGEAPRRLGQPVVVEKVIEVAVAEVPVDGAAQQ